MMCDKVRERREGKQTHLGKEAKGSEGIIRLRTSLPMRPGDGAKALAAAAPNAAGIVGLFPPLRRRRKAARAGEERSPLGVTRRIEQNLDFGSGSTLLNTAGVCREQADKVREQ